MTAASNEVVAVIQADRDIAAPYMGFAFRRVLDGECDDSGLVQQFARHRIAHSDPRPVAEGLREAGLVTLIARALAAKQIDSMIESVGKGLIGTPPDVRANMIERDHIGWIDEAKYVAAALATHSPAPMAGWEDQRPQIASVEAGPEPSLRQMVRFYYAEHGQPDPEGDTAAYFAAHPSTQKGADRG